MYTLEFLGKEKEEKTKFVFPSLKRVDYGPDGLSDTEREELYASINRNGNAAMEAWAESQGGGLGFTTFDDEIFKPPFVKMIQKVLSR